MAGPQSSGKVLLLRYSARKATCQLHRREIGWGRVSFLTGQFRSACVCVSMHASVCKYVSVSLCVHACSYAAGKGCTWNKVKIPTQTVSIFHGPC